MTLKPARQDQPTHTQDPRKGHPTMTPEPLTATRRNDRHAHPQELPYRLLTPADLTPEPYHVNALDRFGRIIEVKVTSIKRWKTRPEIEVHIKYGLYEYGTVTFEANGNQTGAATLIMLL